ncbi:MAG TPA: AraC family transcriptional regulator [Planctomycetota bacterium]|nr:AraC family transcriptional regulator [Planctomycetota bacterium]
MPTPSNLPTDIRFSYEGGNHGDRRHPMRIEWRQLPHGQIEIPDGGSWILELEGRAPVTVRSGEAMVLPRGLRHALGTAGPRTMHTAWAMFCFEDLAGQDMLAAAGIPPVVPSATGRQLVGIMTELRELDPAAARGELSALVRRQALGFRMLELLLAHATVPSIAPPDPELARLLPALRHVEANLARPLYTAELARQAYLSPSRFHSVFKRALGCSPLAHVRNARLRLAQHLLLATDLPVGEIGARAGFTSPYYFSRAFRKHLRTTPTAFRQAFRVYR